MNKLSYMEDHPVTNLDLSLNMLKENKDLLSMENLLFEIQEDLNHIEYLKNIAENFFVFKDTLPDPGISAMTNSNEAISQMSQAAKKSMEKITNYLKEFVRWSNVTLLVSLKNSSRVVQTLMKTVRATPDKKDKLVQVYEVKDINLEMYTNALKNIIKIIDVISDSIAQLRNITGEQAMTDISAVKESITNDTAKFVQALDEFNQNRSNDEKKVTPEDGHWCNDSYLQQAVGAIEDCIASVQKIKRAQSILQQIINGMNQNVDYTQRKENNSKLAVVKDIMTTIRERVGLMSSLATYMGKKCQTMLKSISE